MFNGLDNIVLIDLPSNVCGQSVNRVSLSLIFLYIEILYGYQ